jgi:hypothetical protein
LARLAKRLDLSEAENGVTQVSELVHADLESPERFTTVAVPKFAHAIMPAERALRPFEERLDGRAPLDAGIEQLDKGLEVVPIPCRRQLLDGLDPALRHLAAVSRVGTLSEAAVLLPRACSSPACAVADTRFGRRAGAQPSCEQTPAFP